MKNPVRTTLLVLLASGTLAGCGDQIDRANDAIDQTQERVDGAQRGVDRARDAVEDPVGAAERELDRTLEDAVSPEDQK